MDYVLIPDFARKDLDLKGNELIVYSIIYGFSKDGNSSFYGSRQYLADWCGVTTRQIQTILNTLVDKGLLIKHEEILNGIKYCQYYTDFTPSEKTSPPPSEKTSRGSEKTSLYNIDNNLNIDINTLSKDKEEKPKKKTRYELCLDEIIKRYGEDDEMVNVLVNHLSMICNGLKGVNQWKGLLNDLDRLEGNKIDIVNQSTSCGWFKFYELKSNSSKINNIDKQEIKQFTGEDLCDESF